MSEQQTIDPDLLDLAAGAEKEGEGEKEQQPIKINRLKLLTKPCSATWGAGCKVAVMGTNVPELAATEQEKQQAGHHLANILDQIMPDHWLSEMDPDGKLANIMGSGAVLIGMIQAKANIYGQAVAQAQAEAEAAKKTESTTDGDQ